MNYLTHVIRPSRPQAIVRAAVRQRDRPTKTTARTTANDKAIEVQTRYPRHPEQTKQPAADTSADDAKSDIEDDTFSVVLTSLLPITRRLGRARSMR